MTGIIGILAMLAAWVQPACVMKSASQRQDAVVQFWTWFQLNEKRLRNYSADPATCLGEIHERLQKIAPGLALEAGPEENDLRQVTFTAGGDVDLFPVVREIVRKAPALTGWKFIAFRQRVAEDQASGLSIQVSDIQLSVKDMRFFPVPEADSLDIIIYIRGITDNNYMDVAYHSLNLLDNILGEYDCVMKVRHYDFHPMPTKKNELNDLQPLAALPAYVDSFHQKRKP